MNRNSLKLLAFVLVFAWFYVGGVALSADEGSARETFNNLSHGSPIVIAHRGASGFRPEHTLSAYELALDQGADFIELDLVATSDGALIARHENALAVVELDDEGRIVRAVDGRPVLREATTDVAERKEFAQRLTVKMIDGRPVGGWFSEDFRLAEIQTLKARERMPALRPANRRYDDTEGVPTLADVVAMMAAREVQTNARPGLYLELKHPTYFLVEGRTLAGEPIGTDLVQLLLDELVRLEFTNPRRLYLQCFEVAPLMDLKARMEVRGLDLPLIQLFGDVHNRRYRAAPRDIVYYAGRGDAGRYGELARFVEGGLTAEISYADLATPEVLAFISRRYASGIGPPRQNVLKVVPGLNGGAWEFTGAMEPLLAHAQHSGLVIHPYTLREEAPFLFQFQGRRLSIAEEARVLLEAGVNGFFIDQPARGRAAVDAFLSRSNSQVRPEAGSTVEAGERL